MEEVKSYAKVDCYPFGYNFQLKLLALAFREAKFLAENEVIIQPKYFDSDELRHLTKILLAYFSRYGRSPDLSVSTDLIRTYCIENKFPKEVQSRLEVSFENIASISIEDWDYVKEEATKFAQAQAMREAILKSAKKLDDPTKYSEIVTEIESALYTAIPKSGIIQFSKVALDIPTQLREHSMFSEGRRIKTGIPSLDEHMFGGAAIGKLGFVFAPSGVGKTHTLINFGANAIRNGHSVIHYALGDMNEWEILVRYAANFTGIDSKDIFRGTGPDYVSAMSRWLQTFHQELLISCHPADVLTPSGLRSHISMNIIKTGITPGLIIVDYIDNLATGMKYTVDSAEKSAQLGIMCQQLLKIAHQFNCVIWTGSQVGREHWKEEIVEAGAVSASIKKVEHADYILTLNQTREENARGVARIYEAKIRFGEDKHIIDVDFDKRTSTLREIDSDAPRPEIKKQNRADRLNELKKDIDEESIDENHRSLAKSANIQLKKRQ